MMSYVDNEKEYMKALISHCHGNIAEMSTVSGRCAEFIRDRVRRHLLTEVLRVTRETFKARDRKPYQTNKTGP